MEDAMQWKFWQEPGPQELPVIVKSALISQFNLESQGVNKLRFLGRPGRIGDKQVQFIRIFDPALISGGAAAKPNYHDFQLRFSGNRHALVFEGHIERDGTVLLSDQHPQTPDSKTTEAPATLDRTSIGWVRQTLS
jgi:hypothetical protein